MPKTAPAPLTSTKTYLKSISQLLVALCSKEPVMERGIQSIIPKVEKLLAYTQINKLLVPKGRTTLDRNIHLELGGIK
jgi:hypothetical protein